MTDSLPGRRYRVIGSGAPLFYDEPLHIVRGEGVWLHDAHRRRYLDAYNNVPVVGHCHPRVVEAQVARKSRKGRAAKKNSLETGVSKLLI